MAQRTVVVKTDDIEGTAIDEGDGETISIAIDGVTHEIDLSSKNAQKMRTATQFYVDHGRRVGGRRPAAAQRAPSPTAVDPMAVRAWAQSKGIEVSPRGRMTARVVVPFRDARD